MANLSNYDKTYLSAAQQDEIKALKDQYAAAQTDAERQQIHQQAESIRQSAGYSGGTSGNEGVLLSSANGGKTASQVEEYLKAYNAAGWDPERGWINGYSTAMNTRSKANYIRQQMDANSKAWHTADEAERERLHQENLALAKLIEDYAGGAKSYYDEKTGTWGTWNTDVGYGRDLSWTQPNIANAWKQYYGYTDADREKWDADTSRYYNFVATRSPARNQVDTSSGFTGQYAQFVNGPYGQLIGAGTKNIPMEVYADVFGDGFYDQNDGAAYRLPQYDADGNIILEAPKLKNNNSLTPYTRQFAAYTQNGVIMPNVLNAANPGQPGVDTSAYTGHSGGAVDASRYDNTGGNTVKYVPNADSDPNNAKGQIAYYKNYGQYSTLPSSGSGGGSGASGTGEDYIEQMYANALNAQLSQLETSYNQNVSDLDSSVQKTADQYRESRRQTTGQSAQDAAAWREMANAYGLNSGAIGQAALAQNNQLQSDLNALQAAERAAQDELERNRVLLGQQYQAAINEAIANNDMQKAQALYQEAVRQEEQLIAQQQFNAQMALQYAQLSMQQNQWKQEFAYQQAQDAAAMAARSGSGSGSGSGVQLTKEEMQNQLYADAYLTSDPEHYIRANYKNYGLTSAPTGNYQNWLIQATNGGTMANADMNKLASYAGVVYKNTGNNADYLVSLLRKQGYSDSAIDLVLAKMGL